MASLLLKKLLVQELGETTVQEEIEISSAGIAAMDGSFASKEAIDVLNTEGIDLSSHHARRLEKTDLDRADLVLTMTAAHKQAVLRLAPKAQKKVFTLLEYSADPAAGDVLDPFGQGIEVYQECAEHLRKLLKAIIPKLITALRLDKEDKKK